MVLHAALDVGIEGLGLVEGLVRHEDDLGGACGQIAPILGCSRLHDHRPALRRARHVQRPAHLEVAALVVDGVQLVGVEIDAAVGIAHEGVLLPTVPQALDYVMELGRATIAVCVAELGRAIEVLRLGRGGRGDEVPARAAA
ncbi:hypothetical protein SDC9_138686 [bioreactor metagenome]|uniref:Uncharacterized protein n=1 Tax=bioreactor metagenome TaxID=1076179 RepID=A0A645DQL2_9ZZZZ